MPGRPLAVPLAQGNVLVWIHAVRLDVHVAERTAMARVLSGDERARAARFRFDVDRERFVVGRAMLRRVLAEHAAVPPDRLVFETGRWGKPALRSSALRFNVAHSGTRAIVAVADGVDLGVDLEAVRSLRDVMTVAALVCSDDEMTALRAMTPDERARAFQRCWVRKEACAKAWGVGLHHPFESIEVGVGTKERSSAVHIPPSAGLMGATLIDLGVGTRGVAALAVVDQPRDGVDTWRLAGTPGVCIDTHR